MQRGMARILVWRHVWCRHNQFHNIHPRFNQAGMVCNGSASKKSIWENFNDCRDNCDCACRCTYQFGQRPARIHVYKYVATSLQSRKDAVIDGDQQATASPNRLLRLRAAAASQTLPVVGGFFHAVLHPGRLRAGPHAPAKWPAGSQTCIQGKGLAAPAKTARRFQ